MADKFRNRYRISTSRAHGGIMEMVPISSPSAPGIEFISLVKSLKTNFFNPTLERLQKNIGMKFQIVSPRKIGCIRHHAQSHAWDHKYSWITA